MAYRTCLNTLARCDGQLMPFLKQVACHLLIKYEHHPGTLLIGFVILLLTFFHHHSYEHSCKTKMFWDKKFVLSVILFLGPNYSSIKKYYLIPYKHTLNCCCFWICEPYCAKIIW